MISKRQLLTVGAGALAASTGIWFALPQSQPLAALWQLKLPTLGGKELALNSLKGGPLLINFWATWCPPCVEEMPMLERFYQEYASNGVQMLGIAADKAASVEVFLTRSPVSFPIVLAGFEGISISKALGNEAGGLPHTLLISAKSDILFSKKGQLTADDIKIIAGLVL